MEHGALGIQMTKTNKALSKVIQHLKFKSHSKKTLSRNIVRMINSKKIVSNQMKLYQNKV